MRSYWWTSLFNGAIHQTVRSREVHVGKGQTREAVRHRSSGTRARTSGLSVGVWGKGGHVALRRPRGSKEPGVGTAQVHSLWATLEDSSFCLSPELTREDTSVHHVCLDAPEEHNVVAPFLAGTFPWSHC